MWPLIITSARFLIPTIKSFRKGKKVLGVVNLATSGASINFWRNPIPGKRLTVDKIIAKGNFITQHFYIHPKFLLLDPVIIYTWRKSCENGKRWLLWHISFHITALTGMLIGAS